MKITEELETSLIFNVYIFEMFSSRILRLTFNINLNDLVCVGCWIMNIEYWMLNVDIGVGVNIS
jgi:hypothetical protein